MQLLRLVATSNPHSITMLMKRPATGLPPMSGGMFGVAYNRGMQPSANDRHRDGFSHGRMWRLNQTYTQNKKVLAKNKEGSVSGCFTTDRPLP
jgi:hypothetical protein